MSHPIVGFLEEQGFNATDIGEMLTPMELYDDGDGSAVPSHGGDRFGETSASGERLINDPSDALRSILTAARDCRQLPGPQITVPPGAPAQPGAKAVRVDTNHSFAKMRGASKKPQRRDDVDALTERGQNELMGETNSMYERDITSSEEINGIASNGMYSMAFQEAELLGSDQACVVCGRHSAGTGLCKNCLVERGLVNSELLGFGERGPASDIYTNDALAVRPQESAELIGYTARQMELIGDVMALDPASDIYDQPEEQISLSFSQPEAAQHIAAWQRGPNLYSSIRVTGWDGEPRILTATTPYIKSMGVIVGYAQRAGISPTALLGHAHALAQALGAAGLIPRLAAGSPSVLRAIHGKRGPLIVSTIPARR